MQALRGHLQREQKEIASKAIWQRKQAACKKLEWTEPCWLCAAAFRRTINVLRRPLQKESKPGFSDHVARVIAGRAIYPQANIHACVQQVADRSDPCDSQIPEVCILSICFG